MIGNSPERKPGHELRLKKDALPTAGSAGFCVSCGSPMDAEAVICVGCGFDRRSARHIRIGREARRERQREDHGGFLRSVLVFLLWVGLLAVLGYALYEGYDYYGKHQAAKSDAGTNAPQPWIQCRTCIGQGKTKCATCGGFGSVEAVVKAKCKQCGGTGKYALMSKKTSTACSFCRGSGVNEVLGREPCRPCAGTGWAKCSRCDGRGKIH